jgi:hypothetical protein
MKNWSANTSLGKVILGRQLNYDSTGVLDGEAKTELENVFKAALNEQLGKEIDTTETVSGALTFYFKTEGDLIPRVLPFSVVITSDGFPTNSGENCLTLSFTEGKEDYASDSGKVVGIPVTVINNCIIEKTNSQNNAVHIPVIFDEAYIVLNHKSGSFLGSYLFSPGQGSGTDLVYSVPKSFITNWSSDVNPELISNLTFMPKGTMGKESLTLKLIANVMTSDGLKKLESNEVPFNVSVMKIEDCIKVYDSLGKETDYLTLAPEDNEIDTTSINPTGNTFDMTLKNVCSGLSLKVDICLDNNGEIPKGCGELIDNDYVGFRFGNGDDKSDEFTLNEQEQVTISRPKVSGAYALEIYAKQLKDISSKRVIFLPVNVQTYDPYNYLFTEEPYLDTELDGSKEEYRRTGVVPIYNVDVPGPLKITDKKTFISILEQNKDSEIFFW